MAGVHRLENQNIRDLIGQMKKIVANSYRSRKGKFRKSRAILFRPNEFPRMIRNIIEKYMISNTFDSTINVADLDRIAFSLVQSACGTENQTTMFTSAKF